MDDEVQIAKDAPTSGPGHHVGFTIEFPEGFDRERAQQVMDAACAADAQWRKEHP